MKSLKDIVYVVVIAGVLIIELYYSLTIFKQDKAQIANNLSQIETTDARIEQLERRLAHHEESKRELAQIENQKMALLDTIPDTTQYAEYVNQMFNYLGNTVNGVELEVKNTTNETKESALGTINARTYEIKFISTYTDSRKLVSHLNSMYQAANVVSYEFNTEKQLVEGDEYLSYLALFGDKMNEVGSTSLQLTVFYRLEEQVADESYQVGRSVQNSLAPFENIRNGEGVTGASATGETAEILPISQVNPIQGQDLSGSLFTLNIGDILSSGDTYKLSGPGMQEGHYIGLTTQSNTTISIEVYKDHYTMRMEDLNGQVQETSVEESIESPSLTIISTMRSLQEVMPNIHITVANYTEEVMPISLTGNLLDNIHIYDPSGEEIQQGEVEDRVKLA